MIFPMRCLVLALLWAVVVPGQAAADHLSEIKAREKMIIGVSDAIPPFTFRRNGEVVGYDIDLVRGIAKSLGVAPEFTTIGETDRIKAAQDGRIDLIASTFTRTPDRERQVAFSVDVFNSPQVMIVDKASGLSSIKQMKGLTFGVLKGRTSDQNIAEVVPDAQFVYLGDYKSAFEGLRTRRLSGFAADNLVLRTNLIKEPDVDRFFFIPDFKKDRNAGFGMKRNEPALKSAVDAALLEMEASGEAVRIYNTWFGPTSGVPIERALKIGSSP
jgi:polar amino acid transport system substrate-binding protein